MSYEYTWVNQVPFETLVGKTLTEVINDDSEQILFLVDDGSSYALYHYQDCCESVYVDDVVGDLNDLIGTPILEAREDVNGTDDPPKYDGEESYTWTFYNIRTIKGSVTIKWYGSSNGYYSESVSFAKVG